MKIPTLILSVGISVVGLSNQLCSADETSEFSTAQSKMIRIERAIVKLSEQIQVPAEIPGVLSTVRFREGQNVRKGDVIAEIRNDDLQMRLQHAELQSKLALSAADNDIDVRFAEKSLEVSSTRVARSKRSNARVPGAVPLGRLQEQQLEAHRDALRVEQAVRDLGDAKLQVALASNTVELAKIMLDRSTITSPIDGMVVAVERHAGEWAEPGDTIVRVVRTDRLRIEGFVSADMATRLHVGAATVATFNQPQFKDQEFKGKVIFINPEANPVNFKIQVWVEIDNTDLRLIPGLKATLLIAG